MFIAIDGLDGSGKSTAAANLVSLLRSSGRDVVVVEHPGDTVFGRMCRRLLLKSGKAAVVFSAAFLLCDMMSTGFKARRGGRDVVAVRYTLSILYLPDSVSGFVHRVVESVLPAPDLSVLIDIDPCVALERVEARGEAEEVYENPEDMERVRSKMLSVPGILVVDGSGTPESVTRGIMDAAFPGS